MKPEHYFEDEFSGVGGSYVVDPKSGKRMPEKKESKEPQKPVNKPEPTENEV